MIIEAIYSEFTETFFDPRKRLFLGYFFCAFVIALFYGLVCCRKNCIVFLKKLSTKKVWISASAKADYKIIVINKVLMIFLSPLLISQLALASLIFLQLHDIFPHRPQFLNQWHSAYISLLFTFCYFILDDFARFYVHRLMHRWPILWVFHKVHHSAQRLTPLTVLRTHPVEMLVFSMRSIVVQALSISVFVFFLGDRADLLTIYGAMVFTFVFNVLGSNLRHSHVCISYWKPLEKWLISPAQHQIHHSVAKAHWDKNFGVTLAIWDRLWGSLHYGDQRKNRLLVFGVDGHRRHTLYAVYLQPFVEFSLILCRYFVSYRQKLHSFCYRYCKVLVLWKY